MPDNEEVAAVAADEALEASNDAARAASEAHEAARGIAEANAKAEHSAALSLEMASAAMEGERGRRIEELERRELEWRTERDNLRQSLSSLESRVAEQDGALAALIMSRPDPSTSIPPEPTPNPPNPEPVVAVEDPEAMPAPIVEPPAPATPEAPRKRKHRFL